MAKYLIQDIIPPEKKSRLTAKAGVKKNGHQVEIPPRVRATHKAIVHTDDHTDGDTSPEEITPPSRAQQFFPDTSPVNVTADSAEIPHIETSSEPTPAPETPPMTISPRNAYFTEETPIVVTNENPKSIIIEEMSDMKPKEVAKALTTKPTKEDYFKNALDARLPVTTWPYGNQDDKPDALAPKQKEAQFDHPPVDADKDGSFMSGWVPWIIGFLVTCGAVYFGMEHFTRAVITVLPKRETIPLDQKFTVLKNPLNGELPYSVMKVTLDETREVPATGEKVVTTKASGKIVVFNDQTTPQRLIKNTRFESAKGKIYRINESIDVPKSVTEGGKILPGSIEVLVYADEAGPDWNSDATDFTVPGLKSTAVYAKVYARSKGPLSGGASGTTKTVSDLDLKKASDEIRVVLETKLRAKVRADLPSTQIGFDQGVFVSLGDAALSQTPSSSQDKAIVAETGTIYFLTFDRATLAKEIARSLIPTSDGITISVENLDTLALALPTKTGDDLWKSDTLSVSISGDVSLLWKVDEAQVKKVIAGVPKENFNATLAQLPTIERAKATLQPFWKRSFPTDTSKIVVSIVDTMPI
jgi:hypothetical protein